MRALAAIAGVSLLVSQAAAASSFPETRRSYQRSDAVLLDRHGEIIHELRVDLDGRKLEWAKLDVISPALKKAVLRSEDKRFFAHHGVDWKAVLSAAVGTLFSGGRRGASTITMQLASLLDEGLRPKQGRRSIGQKLKQMQTARALERTWSKDQVLEAYLNLVSYRGELQGIAAASRGIFDKDPSGLDEAESCILASLIRSPNAPPGRVGERAVLLAQSLGSAVEPDAVKSLARDRLARPYPIRQRRDLAPHVAQMLLRGGMTSASTTLDARIQRFALEALQQATGMLADQNVRDGAVLAVDNRSGDVLAYVGNSGDASSARYVDGIQANRQAGSTLKPFLYGLGFEQRIITAASLIEDAPLDLPTTRGLYRPENYDKEFRGMVTARTALASSINIPAVRTAGLLGIDAFVEKLRAFGFANIRNAEHYGPSLALGTADISLWDLTNAYRALANGGIWSAMRLSQRRAPAQPRRALSREAAFIISDILSDREARSATFSLESPLATRYWTAVKTGTSKDMRDNWCVGYSDRYTVGVWIGNFSGAPMWNVSGISGAAPLWLEIMNELHAAMTSRMPQAPDGVTQQVITIADGTRTSVRREWFVAATGQDRIEARSPEGHPGILYPPAGTIIALDPDIPAELQRIYFESSESAVPVRWSLNGADLGQGTAVSWAPHAGDYRVSLTGENGALLDEIAFEVR